MTIAVEVLGRPGMLLDLVEHVLDGHGFARDPEPGDPAPAVTVLVDPDDPLVDERCGRSEQRCIVLRSQLGDRQAVADVQRGADAVFGPDVTADDLVTAVAVVAAGGCLLSPPQARLVVDALRSGGGPDDGFALTPREADILRCAAGGLSVKQTARELGVAAKTVENLQSRLFRKLGVRNRAQAVARAHGAGLLPALDDHEGDHP